MSTGNPRSRRGRPVDRPHRTRTGTGRLAPQPDARPGTVLFLTADTGGGHRAATEAIGHALDGRFPGRFTTVVCDRRPTACYARCAAGTAR
jgi:hypothetical protein